MIFQKPNEPGRVSWSAVLALLGSILTGAGTAVGGVAGVTAAGLGATLTAVSSQIN